MVKKLAHKNSKELLTEAQITEQKLSEGEFTGTWQGRVYILDKDNSVIGKKMGIEKEGEYAIKTR